MTVPTPDDLRGVEMDAAVQDAGAVPQAGSGNMVEREAEVKRKANCFGIPDNYRGWTIKQGPDDRFYVGAPADAVSWDDLRDEIDAWTDQQPSKAGRIEQIACILEPWAWETKSWNATVARDEARAKAAQIAELPLGNLAALHPTHPVGEPEGWREALNRIADLGSCASGKKPAHQLLQDAIDIATGAL